MVVPFKQFLFTENLQQLNVLAFAMSFDLVHLLIDGKVVHLMIDRLYSQALFSA